MSYDDVICLLGDFGRYQRKIYFLLCLPAVLCALHKLGNVFLIAEPNYRCKLPDELENASYYLNDSMLSKYYPRDEIRNKYSSCEIFVNNRTEPCESYIFDHMVYGYTAVIEFGLVCSSSHLIATSSSLFMAGVMLGSILFGELSDRYGRKLTFFISLILEVLIGFVAAITPELWSFTFARLIVGATTSGVFLVAYVIGLEMVGPSKRPIAGTVCQMFFSLGYMLTAAFAYNINNWRWLQFALTLPGVVFFVYWWLIPESSRWLLSKGRTEEAKKLILQAAKYNKVQIPDETLNTLLANVEDTNNKENKGTSVLHIFKYPNMRKKSLIIFFDWFANNLTYYGLSWNTNNLGGDPYWNFVISGAVEIPAYTFLLLFLNRWGRRNVMCSCMMVSGASLLLTMAIPDVQQWQWLIVTLAMIGKLAITSSYGAVYVFSTEQFPTVIRNAGLGAGSTMARFGSILAPYMNSLAHVWRPLPMMVFGMCAFIGGVMSLVLPETLNKKLPETMEEGEAFGKKKTKATVNNIDEEFEVNKKVQNMNMDTNLVPNPSEIGADEKLLQKGVS